MTIRIILIFLVFCLVLPVNMIYSSFADQALFQIGKSRIIIKWESDNQESFNLENFFDILALVAHNYETIKTKNITVVLEYFKKDNNNYILYDDTFDTTRINLRNFKELQKTLKEKIIQHFELNDYIPDNFEIFLIAVPIYEVNGHRRYPEYNEFLEFYYGPAPGNMQIVEGKKLYYQYFFFKEDSIIEILKKEQTFEAILVKKRINRENIKYLKSIFLN